MTYLIIIFIMLFLIELTLIIDNIFLTKKNKELQKQIEYLKSDDGIVEMLHNLHYNEETKLIEYKEKYK